MKEAMAKLFDSVEKSAELSNPIVEGDYLEDGLWMCGKCHTKKQTRVELFGQIRTPFCICKCKAEKLAAAEDERKRIERLQKIERMRKTGFPEADMENKTFSADDGANPKITNICMKYVENFPEMMKRGKGLTLFGTTGTGKTFHAACIANALIDRGYPCMMTNFSRLVNTISGMYEGKQQYIDGLNRFDLLVIDDLATERDTEYMNEIVQNIVDSRYRAGLPTIITTNLSADELKHPTDIRKQRTYSRLLEMTIPIEVAGKDRRKEKLTHDYNDLNEMLGL